MATILNEKPEQKMKRKPSPYYYFAFPIQIGKESNDHIKKSQLKSFANTQKRDQRFLVCYNKAGCFFNNPNEINSKAKFYTENEIKARARQHTVVIDFDWHDKDNTDKDSYEYRQFECSVKSGFERFCSKYPDKAFLIHSSSGFGFHFVAVFNTEGMYLTQESFTGMHRLIIRHFFFDSDKYICKTQKKNGFPATQGWYHADAILDWIEKEIVNTKSTVTTKGNFFNEKYELNYNKTFEELRAVWGSYCLSDEDKVHHTGLVSMAVRRLGRLDLIFKSDEFLMSKSYEVYKYLKDYEIERGSLWNDESLQHVKLRKVFSTENRARYEKESNSHIENEDNEILEKEKEMQSCDVRKSALEEMKRQALEMAKAELSQTEKEEIEDELEIVREEQAKEEKLLLKAKVIKDPSKEEKLAEIKEKDLQDLMSNIFTEHGELIKFQGTSYQHKSSQSAIRSLYNNKPEQLKLGFKRLITLFVTICYGKVLEDEPVGLGVEHVQKMFGGISRPCASILRGAIMEYLAKEKLPYIRNKKVNTYILIQYKIKRFFKPRTRPAARIAKLLGNGQTFMTLTRYVPALYYSVGARQAKEVLSEAIEISDANDKRKRLKELERYINKLAA